MNSPNDAQTQPAADAPADQTVKTTTEVPVNPAPAPTTPTADVPATPTPDQKPVAQGDGASE